MWVGDWGQYRIPDEFMNIRFTRDGRIDSRFKSDLINRFKTWLADAERRAKAGEPVGV